MITKMARLSVAQGPCSAVLPTVHGCHNAFQKFPFFFVSLCTFSASTLCNFLEDFESALPMPVSFEESGTEMPFVILGDEAYPLKTYPMKPFTRKDLSSEERALTYRLSRTRRCVECAFAILTAKWRLLNKAIETKAERIVRCICLLHNIIIDLEGTTRDNSVLQDKGKAFPLQAWSGAEGSRKLRFPDFITTAQDGGKVVSLTHRPPLSPGNAPGTYFC